MVCDLVLDNSVGSPGSYGSRDMFTNIMCTKKTVWCQETCLYRHVKDEFCWVRVVHVVLMIVITV